MTAETALKQRTSDKMWLKKQTVKQRPKPGVKTPQPKPKQQELHPDHPSPKS